MLNLPKKRQKTTGNFVKKVQCSRDNEIDAGFQFTTMAPNKPMTSLTDKQSRPLDELKDGLKETNLVEKPMFSPLPR